MLWYFKKKRCQESIGNTKKTEKKKNLTGWEMEYFRIGRGRGQGTGARVFHLGLCSCSPRCWYASSPVDTPDGNDDSRDDGNDDCW